MPNLVEQRNANLLHHCVVRIANLQDGATVDVDAIGQRRLAAVAVNQRDANIEAKQG